MKKWLLILFCIQAFSGVALAHQCGDPCSQSVEGQIIPIHGEWGVQEISQCKEIEKASNKTCAKICNQTQGANYTPVDFIVSFLINPFFTSSFLAPEECQAPVKKS